MIMANQKLVVRYTFVRFLLTVILKNRDRFVQKKRFVIHDRMI